MLVKFCLVLAVIAFTSSTKVQLSCHDKSKYCVEESKEDVCSSDLSKLICRRTCDHCQCVDSEHILCKQDDVCHSQEGRLLCQKTCDACEFRYLEGSKGNYSPPAPTQEPTIEPSKAAQSMQERVDDDDSKASSVGSTHSECLKWHNKWRSHHKDTPEMEWDEELAQGAQEWAEKLVGIESLQHAPGQINAGENLFMQFLSKLPADYSACKNAALAWYEESVNPGYDYSSSRSNSGTGHFTQLVWRESTKLGCGAAKGRTRGMQGYYVCCRYSPAGNHFGKFNENVMELKSGLSFPKLLKEFAGDKRNLKRFGKKSTSKVL